MAVPHVAGVASFYLEKYPNASPKEVKKAILRKSSKNNIILNKVSYDTTPNRLIYSKIFE